MDVHTHRMDAPCPSIYSVRLGVRGTEMPQRPFSAGVHPWDVNDMPDGVLDGIRSDFLYAVGETGLDFAAGSDRGRQYEWFRRQLALASELEMPAVIHCVKAFNETIAELKNFDRPVIFHGFTGSPELARQVLGADCYLSFGANLFRSPKTAEALRATPRDRLFLETDDSGLDIKEIYSEAARIYGCDVSELKNDIHKNYLELFPPVNG